MPPKQLIWLELSATWREYETNETIGRLATVAGRTVSEAIQNLHLKLEEYEAHLNQPTRRTPERASPALHKVYRLPPKSTTR